MTALPLPAHPAPGERVASCHPDDGDPARSAGPGRLRLDEQLCFALYSATNAVTRTYRPLLHALGLTYPQYLVMMALWERDDVTMTDLSTRLDLPLHGLSPVVDRLCHDQLVERKPDPHDRRLRRLLLTDPGRDLEPAAAGAQAQVVNHSRISTTRLEQLRDQLHHLTYQLRHSSDANSQLADADTD